MASHAKQLLMHTGRCKVSYISSAMQKQYESDVVECGANGPDDQFISRPQ